MKERKNTTDMPTEAPVAIHNHGFPLVVGLIVAGSFLTTIPLMSWSFRSFYGDKIYPKVAVGGVSIGNMTTAQAQALLTDRAELITSQGVTIRYQGKEVVIPAAQISLNPDLPDTSDETLFTIDPEASVMSVYAGKQQPDATYGIRLALQSLFSGTDVPASYTINNEAIREAIAKEFGTIDSPAKNAAFTWNTTTRSLEVKPESSGELIDYARAMHVIGQSLGRLEPAVVTLTTTIDQPKNTRAAVEPLIEKAKSILTLAPITLELEKKRWTVDESVLASWLIVTEGQIRSLTLDDEKVQEYLNVVISPKIDIEEQAPRFELKNGVLTEIQHLKKGRALDIPATLAALRVSLFDIKHSTVTLVVTDQVGEDQYMDAFAGETIELIATGESQFNGSPKNRIKNIRVGAAKVHGVIIRPDEEFSLVSTLGTIDAKAGYLPELVIKGNRTIPEYGGGLCQIGTTVFRAATYSGLPILERRNHSYAVQYYNPLGFDATIYDPKPDFKFKNDTGHVILIQTKIEGTTLKVEFWGKKDQRTVEVDKPRVFNIVKAGKAKLIESAALKPGEKKCSGAAHDGADAIFERRITYANGEQKKDVFKSRYVAWPAVCLIGKALPDPTKNAADAATAPALSSTTPEATPPTGQAEPIPVSPILTPTESNNGETTPPPADASEPLLFVP